MGQSDGEGCGEKEREIECVCQEEKEEHKDSEREVEKKGELFYRVVHSNGESNGDRERERV